MTDNSNLGQHIKTIHNPESVVEIYLNIDLDQVTEVKSLNYNRYKNYKYSINEYLKKISGFKGVDKALLIAIKA